MNKKSIAAIFSLIAALVPCRVHGLETAGRNWTYTERTDLRRYDNGRYTGLLSREVRSFVTAPDSKAGKHSALFCVLNKTVRNRQDARKSINMATKVDFTLDEDGKISLESEIGYPSIRDFPVIPDGNLSAGDSWTGESIRCVDPMENGCYTHLKMLVSYRYLRKDVWKGRRVHVISASWATRIAPAVDGEKKLPSDPLLLRASGSHSATLYIDVEDGTLLLCQDSVDEIFSYRDGKTVAFKGTVNLFNEHAASVNRKTVEESVKDSFPVEDGGNVQVGESESGLVLTLKNLQFEPDSAVLLPGETQRLDLISGILKKAPDSVFLITGHAASTGNPSGELKVSEDRARAIAGALVERGIDPEKIMCRGAGASEPIASNDSPEGRAANRRVEITILE